MSSRAASTAELARIRGDHEAFSRFQRWEGTVPENFIVNFLGVMTRTSFWPPYCELSRQYPKDRYVHTGYPPVDEEYFEWIDLLESIAGARGHFTMIELGAGWGRWTVNAAAALRQSSNLPCSFIAVEAEPTHFQWMVEHLKDNSVDRANCQLIQAAVAGAKGKVGFHVGETKLGAPATWYGQHLGGPVQVDAVTLSELLRPLALVDLIDLDVQGAELEVLSEASGQLDQKVKRVHVGTHSAWIEEGLRSIFARVGWRCVHSFPCESSLDTEWGRISFQDGVQTWLNPGYMDVEVDEVSLIKEKLASAQQEAERLWVRLEKLREERNSLRAVAADSLAWKILETGGRLRDSLFPRGTRRRAFYDSIAGKD